MQCDRLGGHLAVRVLVVRGRRGVVRQGAAKLPRWCQVRELSLLVLVDASRIDECFPRRRVVQPARADLPGVPVVVDLPDTRDEVPVPSEHLRQRDDVGDDLAKVGLQVVDARGIGPQAGQQRHPARAAQRKLRVGAVEPDAACGQAIQVGSLDQRMPERAEVVVEIVGHDQEHVGASCLRRLGHGCSE